LIGDGGSSLKNDNEPYLFNQNKITEVGEDLETD
jgi:hypothetical protein